MERRDLRPGEGVFSTFAGSKAAVIVFLGAVGLIVALIAFPELGGVLIR